MDSPAVHVHGIFNAITRSSKFYKKPYVAATLSTICLIIILTINFTLFNHRINYSKICQLIKMNDKPFYVELISNSVSYADNTLTDFKNKLSLITPLNGQWEVALVEISYTKSWKNVIEDCQLFIDSDISSNLSSNSTVTDTYVAGILKAGHYDSIEILLNEIENKLKLTDDKNITLYPKYEFDNITKRVHLIPGKHKNGNLLMPRLSDEVSDILGFTNFNVINSTYNEDKLDFIANRPADITAGIHTLYVYADIVEPQYIGDTRVKLLRTVEVPSDRHFGDTVVFNYSNAHYVPVLVNEFEHIEINLRDDAGRPIPFMRGRTKLKLHFRKQNS